MSDEMIAMVEEETAERMAKAVAHARHEMAAIRTGRANSGLVEDLVVEYYGTPVPLKQLASFSVPEARMLVIAPFDKGSMESIEKAIRSADLGLNPSNDGVVIRLGFPILTVERRREFVKMAKTRAEECRNQVRGARREGRKDLDALQRAGDISEDDKSRSEAELDRLAKLNEAQIDEALDRKTTELLEG